MKNELLHTPEGVRDIYSDECARKHVLEQKIQKKFNLYGYRDIETPSFEFFDVFNKERGSIASKNMFKFFDREGNTLVLRPDVTPSIARCAAKYYHNEELPVKLCYNAKTFINNNSYQGRLKETTQLGAELIGDGSIDADAEVIALVIDSLLETGLKEFMVEISDVGFFKGLVSEAGISEEGAETLRDLIQNKNFFAVEKFLNEGCFPKDVAERLLKLPQLFGTVEVLDEAKALTSNVRALDSIERLRALYNILSTYGFEKYVTFDLGMLGNLDYYTGVVFKAYTYGTGDAIVNGGRYDRLLSQFGKDMPAIGFGVTSDQLLMALSRQKIEVSLGRLATMILYEEEAYELAIGLAKEHRSAGECVNLMLKLSDKNIDDYLNYSVKNNIGGILYVKNTSDLEIINASTKEVKSVKLSDFK